MRKWTPVVIEGGKADATPETDILEAFERAGFVTESGLFDYDKILENLDANHQSDASLQNQPVVMIVTDQYGEQHFQFLF